MLAFVRKRSVPAVLALHRTVNSSVSRCSCKVFSDIVTSNVAIPTISLEEKGESRNVEKEDEGVSSHTSPRRNIRRC